MQRPQHRLFDELMSLAAAKENGHIDIPLSPRELSNILGPGAVKEVSSTAALPSDPINAVGIAA